MTSVESGDTVDTSLSFADFMPLSREGLRDNATKIWVVVYDQDVCHYTVSFS